MVVVLIPLAWGYGQQRRSPRTLKVPRRSVRGRWRGGKWGEDEGWICKDLASSAGCKTACLGSILIRQFCSRDPLCRNFCLPVNIHSKIPPLVTEELPSMWATTSNYPTLGCAWSVFCTPWNTSAIGYPRRKNSSHSAAFEPIIHYPQIKSETHSPNPVQPTKRA